VLARAFSAEIERAVSQAPSIQHLPLQLGNNKAVRECVELGYLVPDSQKLGSALGALTINGYELTHFGRFLYCEICSPEEGTA
jgi:hypothetical protein